MVRLGVNRRMSAIQKHQAIHALYGAVTQRRRRERMQASRTGGGDEQTTEESAIAKAGFRNARKLRDEMYDGAGRL